jgi:ferredoxin-type protein NapF
LGALQDVLFLCAVEVSGRWWRAPSRSWCWAKLDRIAKTPPVPSRRHAPRLARRGVLGALAGVAWAAAVRRVRNAASRPLRPPGARDDVEFVGLCIRCGNCIRACPSRIIEPDLGGHGVAALLTPVVHFEEDYCHEDCTRCMEVCPSGALTRRRLDEKQCTKIGLARVDMGICLLGDDRDCAVCRNCCPYEAIALVFSQTDYTLTPMVDPQKCPGCGACEAACPTRPARAIVVSSLEFAFWLH